MFPPYLIKDGPSHALLTIIIQSPYQIHRPVAPGRDEMPCDLAHQLRVLMIIVFNGQLEFARRAEGRRNLLFALISVKYVFMNHSI